jgi:hypothetical protein
VRQSNWLARNRHVIDGLVQPQGVSFVKHRVSVVRHAVTISRSLQRRSNREIACVARHALKSGSELFKQIVSTHPHTSNDDALRCLRRKERVV